MLRAMNDMPPGTLGFEAIGELEDDDWEAVVEPVLRADIAAGRRIRMLYLIGARARGVDDDAMRADASFHARHATSFERVAVVSDEDWMRPVLRALSAVLPGRARGFRVRDLGGAKDWLVEDLAPADDRGATAQDHAANRP
jgi:SpoIIAA-like